LYALHNRHEFLQVQLASVSVTADPPAWKFDYIKASIGLGSQADVHYFNGPQHLHALHNTVAIPASRERQVARYDVTFWSADACFAGTDAALAICLTGDEGETGLLPVRCPACRCNASHGVPVIAYAALSALMQCLRAAAYHGSFEWS
jgi:hypothetical protein